MMDKIYDNEDENLIKPVEPWLEYYLNGIFYPLMSVYGSNVELLLVGVDDENETITNLIVLN